MQKIIDFLNVHNSGYLATIENGMPRVRPWRLMFIEDSKFWFLTTSDKEIYQQLLENPYVEFCSSAPDFSHVRLRGKINFYEKNEKEEESALLKGLFETYDDTTRVFYIEHGSASKMLSSGKNETFDF